MYVNNTPYTLKQIKGYVAWKKWKWQPTIAWERALTGINFEFFYDGSKKISYDVIRVDESNTRSLTIKLDDFKHYLLFYCIDKPKQFKLHEISNR